MEMLPISPEYLVLLQSALSPCWKSRSCFGPSLAVTDRCNDHCQFAAQAAWVALNFVRDPIFTSMVSFLEKRSSVIHPPHLDPEILYCDHCEPNSTSTGSTAERTRFQSFNLGRVRLPEGLKHPGLGEAVHQGFKGSKRKADGDHIVQLIELEVQGYSAITSRSEAIWRN